MAGRGQATGEAHRRDRAWRRLRDAVGGGMANRRLAIEPDLGEIPRLIDWVERCCGEAGIASDLSFRLALALDEAVTNVIGHAFAGQTPPHRIEIELDITD